MKIVYVIGTLEGCHKIGVTRNLTDRIRNMVALPVELREVISFPTHDFLGLERYLHTAFNHKRVRGEWFRLSAEDLALISQIQIQGGFAVYPPELAKLHQSAGRVSLRQKHAWGRSDSNASKMVRVPRWLAAGCRDMGNLQSPRESIAQVLERLVGDSIRREYADLPPLPGVGG